MSSYPSYLLAFPSVISSLDSLPHATNLATVCLHPTTHTLRAAQSEAKVQHSLLQPVVNVHELSLQLRRALASKPSSRPMITLPPPSRSPVSHTDYNLVMRKLGWSAN
ncbi:hypothetical protein BDN72DRAFT_901352 [Pluteus cervinus]|uniref:Uncharacterized protein n=1 Tax=Pluteus cervinus TaxID=181527 RepID=A0ACD3AH37_9AGAR|nr:hypothetical protein BDN72DRAFT_901352 [Pluteus cervinus]